MTYAKPRAPAATGLHGRFETAIVQPLLRIVEAAAGFLLAVDVVIVTFSVVHRYFSDDPIEWSDDVARMLLVALTFFGAAAALARGETAGIEFFVDKLPRPIYSVVNAAGATIVLIMSAAVCVNTLILSLGTMEQTTGTGLPQNLFYYPIVLASACMTVFAASRLWHCGPTPILKAVATLLFCAGLWFVWKTVAPAYAPRASVAMGLVFLVCLVAAVPIGFALAFSTLIFICIDDRLPGAIIAQQTVRGIDNFVLLAVPFFVLVGYVMDVNGMSVRLIELLRRLVGRVRGGLNIVMVLSMVVFSGVSGSKMADVAAVGTVLIPAARRSRQDPAEAVALLAASAVMAEVIPPCIALIILGFVANLSIGGLFMAGLLPAGFMALVLIVLAVIYGEKAELDDIDSTSSAGKLWGSAAVTFGLIGIIFGGYRSGFATATEISAYAVLYAILVGGLAFRELTVKAFAQTVIDAATRSGMVLFITAVAQSVAFVLTVERIPHDLAEFMITLSQSEGTWIFLVLSILILILMGSVLEGAPALIIFGPLLVPVARTLGIEPLHYGIILIVAMGIGLFAPPLGLGLYGACMIGDVSMEKTVRPLMKYLGALFVCLLVLAFVPEISMWLPRVLGYG